jgi:2,4-dienoyl-CoA reductase-like NADH-dependent reductase (Old Yellow Enzyme family)
MGASHASIAEYFSSTIVYQESAHTMHVALFQPLQIGPLTVANRIVVAPMCQYSANDGVMSEWHLAHLTAMASSGPGMVVIEATAVEQIGRISHGCVGLYSDEAMEAMADVIRFVKRTVPHVKIGVQLAHAGRKASAPRPWQGSGQLAVDHGGWPVVAPSAIPFDAGYQTPTALDDAGIERIIDAFRQAALRAVQAGVDAIELHMAHGYLLHSFISPLTNQRTDRWGGDWAGRMAMPLAVTAAVRDAIPAHVALGARITGSDWHAAGLGEADAVAQAQLLAAAGLHFVCVSSGGAVPGVKIPVAPSYQVPFATAVKRGSGLVTRAVGMINDPQVANRIVADGEADLVALGRAMLDNPTWPRQAAIALGAEPFYPKQYERSGPKLWPLKNEKLKIEN